jgi:hypothetical protein
VIAWLFGLLLLLVPKPVHAAGAEVQCAQRGDDETPRPYDPSLQTKLVTAYFKLFPHARLPPQDQFQAGAHTRCMDGHMLACFSGANLPCGKLNLARDNPGAAAFCEANPNAQIVPAYATGHDAAYLYRCAGKQAEISGETYLPDTRGFAGELWTPLD